MDSSSRRRDTDHVAGRRSREVYRYFRPERTIPTIDENSSLSLDETTVFTPDPASTTSQDRMQPPSTKSPSASPHLLSTVIKDRSDTHLSPEELVLGDYNATLTSFAQLAALRLEVERVLISVSDRNSQFILAQAARTSQGDEKLKSVGNGIWNGASTLSLSEWKMCKDTVTLPPSDRENREYSFVIINDLSAHKRYQDLPFVKGEPNFRFYAGTPLTTHQNINIGSIFALDSNPRDGLSEPEKETLGTLATLIIDYLKVSRQASEGRRATRLSRGLSCFVEGSSSFVGSSSDPSYAGSIAQGPSTPPLSNGKANHLSVGSHASAEGPSRRSHSRSQSSDARSISSVDSRVDQGASSAMDNPLPDYFPNGRQSGLDESHGSSWTFRRAANLLRESLELTGDGGVIFLEAGNNPAVDMDAETDGSEGSNPASVLAISTSEEPFAPGPGSTVQYPAAKLDRSFLHQLFSHHSKGKLWSFHRDGFFSSSDDESKKARRSRSATTKSLGRSKSTSKKFRKSDENATLNSCFPGATQVLFVPLWNAANSQWFSGCFCWNNDETRVFNTSVELSSVLGFGSSIMAECNRVESLISDRQKGDFIGSISHELRSPLHGILAAAEFLQGTNLDEFQGSLLETINACGRTLLDTMNQVLDFSKIVSLERTWRQMKRRKAPSSDMNNLDRSSAHLDTFMATDLAVLAEEVVEGVSLGHAYGQKSTATSDMPATMPSGSRERNIGSGVEVELDIAHNDWVYRTQPGALRRVIMNLFGNAMKYTEAGRVSLRLEVTEASDNRTGEDIVALTVSDTGKGISEEFLRGRLYTPFAQEDHLAVGTGLGLSIVRSLVRALGGNIDIQSQPGQGTTVKVSLPLARSDPEEAIEAALDPKSPGRAKEPVTNESYFLRDAHTGRRAAFLGVDPCDLPNHPQWSVISRYLVDWYDLEIVSWSPNTPVDVVLADEEALITASSTYESLMLPPLLVLCDQSADHKMVQSRWSPCANTVKMLRQPWGPQKLARTIRGCLDGQAQGLFSGVYKDIPERPRNLTRSSTDKASTLSRALNSYYSGTEMTTGTTVASENSSRQATPSQSSGSPSTVPVEVTDTSPPDMASFVEQVEVKVPRKARILVVDDNSINLNLMMMFLKKRNLDGLRSAEHGQAAVDVVEQEQWNFDIIFMDMSMPVMDGFEATRAIRAIERERACTQPAIIVAVTGLSSSRDETEAITSGVDLFLTKPVSFKEVSKLLDEWEEKGLRDRSLSLIA